MVPAAPVPVRPPTASSSVVVDPISQMPEAPHERQRRRGVEATEILKGRRLDALRAEVAQKRKAHRRRQQRTLLLWGLAGAAALCLGWIAGRAFTPEQTDEVGTGEANASQAAIPTSSPLIDNALGAGQPIREPSDRKQEPDRSPDAPVRKETTPSAKDQAVVSLEDLPLAEEVEGDGEETADPERAPEEAADGAFTLDDLPAD